LRRQRPPAERATVRTHEAAVRSAAAASAVAVCALLLRWLTTAKCAYGIDPVNYALAVSRFDVRLQQPHPPGLLWFVLLARAIMPLAREAHRALIYANLLGSFACVVLAYLLAARVFGNRRAAVAASVLAATSPLLWFYGSVGERYVWEAVSVLTIAYLAWRAAHSGGLGWLAVLSGALGLVGGLGPFHVVFLLPLWAWVVLRNPPRPLAAAAVGLPLVAAGIVAWLLPTVLMSGGWGAYRTACLRFGSGVTWAGWRTPAAVIGNLKNFVAWVGAGFGAAIFPALWLVLSRRAAVGRAVGPWSGAGAFWIAAIAPASAFYILGHLSKPGYMLAVVPLLIVILAGALDIALGTQRGMPWRAFVLSASAAANCAFFLCAAPLPVRSPDTWSLPSWRLRLARQVNRSVLDLTWGEIRDHDSFCRRWQCYARAHFRREDTVLVGEEARGRRGYPRQMAYYLREYLILGLDHQRHRHAWYRCGARQCVGGRVVAVPPGARHLVWLVEDLPAGADTATRSRFAHRATLLGRARELQVLELPTNTLPISYLGFRVVRAETAGR